MQSALLCMTDLFPLSLQLAMHPPEMRPPAGVVAPEAPPGMQLHPLGMVPHGVLVLLPGTPETTRMHPRGEMALLPSGEERHLLQQGAVPDGRQMLLRWVFW